METYRNFSRWAVTFVAVLLVLQPDTTLAYLAAPVANTKNPTFITEKSVILNGSVNPNEVPDTYAWFEWGISGRTTTYETTHRQTGGASTLTDFSQNLYGLAPNVQYFYRLVAESSRGRDVGITTYFTTKTLTESIDPIVIVETRAPTTVAEKSAILRGYIAPHEGQGVKWWFEYGTTNRLENTTQVGGWGTDSGVAQMSVANLTPGTSYMYRIAAENTQGIVYGGIRTFTTTGTTPLPGEVARAQNIASPQAGDGVSRTGASTAGGGGVAAGYGAATASNGVIPGAAYYPPAALNFPTFNFNSLFGGNKAATANNSAASGSATGATAGGNSNTSAANPANSQIATAAAATPIGSFWNTLTGKKIAEVTIEKIGPTKAPAHTAVEYRITYAYRRSSAATNAKLKVVLPGSVVYIGDNTTNELLLEEGSGPERTYVLPVGRLESGSTRTISILGMTTGDATGTFPDARARLEYSPSSGGVEVVSAEGTAAAAAGAKSATAQASSSSFSIFPSSILGWVLYIAIITLIIFAIRKGRAYYAARKEEIALEEEARRREREGRQLGNGAIPA